MPKYIAKGYCYQRHDTYCTFRMRVLESHEEMWDIDNEHVPEGCEWGSHVRLEEHGTAIELYDPVFTEEEQKAIDDRVEELNRLLKAIE